jgi:type IV fimbrial biogenesis protein FimT
MRDYQLNERSRVAAARMLGFSLIEVLTAISLVAMLSSIAVPAMVDFVRNARVRNASFELRAVLVRARSEAINRNTEVQVVPTAAGWMNGWTLQTTDGTNIEQFSSLSNVNISPLPAPTVVYRVDGRVRSGSQQIVVSLDGLGAKVHPRCVSLSPSGLPATRIDNNFDPTDGCT